ncbi:exonuclease domain-containing protein [Streptococcus sp. E17BB]|uniref:exonuclease domain-containing protein n=1 Tax=Streptococcus sp. E17BB TaxID=3278714 RepID=UPI00359CCEAE
MPKTLLSETVFTVVTIEDQWLSPVGCLEKNRENSKQFANLSCERDLIKISAVTFTLSENLAHYQVFIKPSQPLSDFTRELTGIIEANFKEAVSLTEALQGLVHFCQDTVLVCHNAVYVFGMLAEKMQECSLPELEVPRLDTGQMVTQLHPEWKRKTSSKGIAKQYQLDLEHLDYPYRIQVIFKAICQELQSTQKISTAKDLQAFFSRSAIA